MDEARQAGGLVRALEAAGVLVLALAGAGGLVAVIVLVGHLVTRGQPLAAATAVPVLASALSLVALGAVLLWMAEVLYRLRQIAGRGRGAP
jgi:predicted deacylase